MTEDERLVRCFRRVFPQLDAAQIRSAHMRTLAAWDSIALLRLVSHVESEFCLRFDPSHVNRIASFSSMLDIVRTLRAAGAP